VVSNETQEIGAAINRPANLLKDEAEQGAGAWDGFSLLADRGARCTVFRKYFRWGLGLQICDDVQYASFFLFDE